MDTVNIFAPELRKKIRKEVPTIPGAWVDFYDDITMDTVDKAQEATGMDLLLYQIAEWNFADEKGLLEISLPTLKRFPSKLLKWLTETQIDLLQNVSDEAKKKEDQQTTDPSPDNQEQQA